MLHCSLVTLHCQKWYTVNLVDPYIFIAVDSVTNQCILDLDSTLQNCTHPDTMSCQWSVHMYNMLHYDVRSDVHTYM